VNAKNASGSQTPRAAEYVSNNAGKNTKPRYRALSHMYDASTIGYIDPRGIGRGWSCLEVGGGRGSLASWPCARVGTVWGHGLARH